MRDSATAESHTGPTAEAAWVPAEVLWHLRDSSELTNAYMAVLDRTVGMENRVLLLVREI